MQSSIVHTNALIIPLPFLEFQTWYVLKPDCMTLLAFQMRAKSLQLVVMGVSLSEEEAEGVAPFGALLHNSLGSTEHVLCQS